MKTTKEELERWRHRAKHIPHGGGDVVIVDHHKLLHLLDDFDELEKAAASWCDAGKIDACPVCRADRSEFRLDGDVWKCERCGTAMRIAIIEENK
jgi:hypothetical protein